MNKRKWLHSIPIVMIIIIGVLHFTGIAPLSREPLSPQDIAFISWAMITYIKIGWDLRTWYKPK